MEPQGTNKKDSKGHVCYWHFDGDDQYLVCSGCGKVRDALNGDEVKTVNPADVFVKLKEVPDPEGVIFGESTYIREDLVAKRVDKAKLNGALQCLMSLDIGTYTQAGKTIDEEITKIGKALRELNRSGELNHG
jgi:rubredoxin